jgi:hypothetical protein
MAARCRVARHLYADAIPLDLLKSEQVRIATAITNAEGRLAGLLAFVLQAPEATLLNSAASIGLSVRSLASSAPRKARSRSISSSGSLNVAE